jgi:hypothetical protein
MDTLQFGTPIVLKLANNPCFVTLKYTIPI